MKLTEAELVLNSLQDLTVDIKHFPSKAGFELAKTRKAEAINIMREKIKDIIFESKRIELCSSILDSLGSCPICGEEALVSYMAGGSECKNCGDSEIAF